MKIDVKFLYESSENGIESEAAVETVVRGVGHPKIEKAESGRAVEGNESSIEGWNDVSRGEVVDDGVDKLIRESGEGSGRGSSEGRLQRKDELERRR